MTAASTFPADASADVAGLLAKHPRLRLLEAPTRLQRLSRLEDRLRPGRALYIKRDDEMGIAVGGNKLRSLEFWLGEAREQGADTVLVAGAPVSNQCRLTAAAAAMAGLRCIVFHNAEPSHAHADASFLNRVFGAQVRFIGPLDEESRWRFMVDAAADLRRGGARPYVVGEASVGALGYVAAAQELLAQSREQGAGIRHVFLPGSMGPTEAGFILGNALLGSPFEVHLVSVEYAEDELARRIARILGEAAQRLAVEVGSDVLPGVRYHMNALGPGYGVSTPEAEAALLTLARAEGILLEHTYTAKTFAGMTEWLEHRRGEEPAEAVAFLHTGGVPALFGQIAAFQTI